MREQILVCPFDEKLLGQLSEEGIVVESPGFEQVQYVHNVAREKNKKVICVAVRYKGSIATIPFHESWRGIPLAIYATELGPFKEFMSRLQLIREMNIRFFLNTDHKETFTSLHILSSLNVNCGIEFGEKPIDWEALNDLMTFSCYGKAPHSGIEPFQFVATKYNPKELTDFGTVFFNNPQVYLHIDKDQNIAASAADLKKGNFIATGLKALNDIKNNPKYEDAVYQWQNFFLQEKGCAFCPSWRICLGKFSTRVEKNPGCQKFFSDLMEAADHVIDKQQKKRERDIWQP